MPKQPNILIVFSDQQRWDTLGVNGSPMGLTPNLDSLARRGTRFILPITNQPVCAPARACLLTGQYATTHGVWRNGANHIAGQETLATSLSHAGYATGYVGKWHLAPPGNGPGHITADYRGGFQEFWEAANALEFTSQPFETVLFDHDGEEVRPPGYRVDAMTDRTIACIDQLAATGKPWLTMVSFLEPHHQNDVDRYVPPEGYEARYANPFVPPDLRPLPGNWVQQLPGYYGCIRSLDENVGRLISHLEATTQLDNTIVVYTADHGCHFRTRNNEYKRSCHDSSLRIPLVIAGPGFDARQLVPEPVGIVDLMPSLLDAAGVDTPKSVQGRSYLPLVRRDSAAIDAWQQETFVQISESGTARAIRSDRWTYCVTAPAGHGATHTATGPQPVASSPPPAAPPRPRQPGPPAGGPTAQSSDLYAESHLYDNYADPFQHTNLLGRHGYGKIATRLRERLLERLTAAGETIPEITPFAGQTPP